MKSNVLSVLLTLIIATFSSCELQVSNRPLVFTGWPPKSVKQGGIGRSPGGKRTLVVQIRSDKPVPIVLKRPGHQQIMGGRPIARPHNKIVLKHGPPAKLALRKPSSLLKIKLPSVKPVTFDKPYHYELPYQLVSEVQKLPHEETHHFISDHFAPIHTIPAPNLAIHDNHIYQADHYLPPQPQPYHHNQYQVNEEPTNDQTIVDPFSGKQKLFAPDPDPSLPTAKIRPAVEPHNTPSNGKPLPSDIQSNYLPHSQSLVSPSQPEEHQQVPEIFGVQYVTQPIQLAPIAVQNPSYLVTQSNQLFHQHQQELFRPYVDTDLSQEVASSGQILQAAKDSTNNIHSTYTVADAAISAAPQFAALIAATPASTGHAIHLEHRAPFQLTNVAAAPQHGEFVVSNVFGNAPADSQLLQAFAEEEAQREQAEAQHQAQLEYEQHLHQLDLQHQHQHRPEYQVLTPHHEHSHSHNNDPATAAFEEHQRLVHQQLGPQALRIFVPDEEAAFDRHQQLKKRSDKVSTDRKDTKEKREKAQNSSEKKQ